MTDAVTLTIIRHGKAEKESLTGLDEDRQLRPRGVKQAHYLGTLLAGQGDAERPQVVLASPVTRAAETARIIAQLAGLRLEFYPELSTSSHLRELMQLLLERFAAGRERRIAIVGHNPTLEELVLCLCADATNAAGGRLRTAPGVTFSGMRTGMGAVVGFGELDPAGSRRDSKQARPGADDKADRTGPGCAPGLGFAPGRGTLAACLRENWDEE